MRGRLGLWQLLLPAWNACTSHNIRSRKLAIWPQEPVLELVYAGDICNLTWKELVRQGLAVKVELDRVLTQAELERTARDSAILLHRYGGGEVLLCHAHADGHVERDGINCVDVICCYPARVNARYRGIIKAVGAWDNATYVTNCGKTLYAYSESVHVDVCTRYGWPVE